MSRVHKFLVPAVKPEVNCSFALVDGVVTATEWNVGVPQPTAQELADAEADRTTVNGQVFSEWLAEHGGDATATLRRQARGAIDSAQVESAMFRAALLVMVDEFNRHTGKFTALRDAIANANSLAEVKAAAAAIEPLPTRTGQDLRDAAIAKIDSGAADS